MERKVEVVESVKCEPEEGPASILHPMTQQASPPTCAYRVCRARKTPLQIYRSVACLIPTSLRSASFSSESLIQYVSVALVRTPMWSSF